MTQIVIELLCHACTHIQWLYGETDTCIYNPESSLIQPKCHLPTLVNLCNMTPLLQNSTQFDSLD